MTEDLTNWSDRRLSMNLMSFLKMTSLLSIVDEVECFPSLSVRAVLIFIFDRGPPPSSF